MIRFGKSPETARMLLMMAIMAAVGLLMSGVAIVILYDTSFTQSGQRLRQTVESHARMIEAITRNEMTHLSAHGVAFDPADLEETVMRQVREAHHRFKGFGETGEFTMGKMDGENIVFVLRHRHADQDEPLPVPMNSPRAAPMRQALQGESGVLIGLDYRGVTVLAAHEPVAILNLGVVAKIDMEELRRPFLRAGLQVAGIGMMVIVIGTFLFYRIGHPMVQQLMETAALRESREALIEAQAALQEKAVHLDNILRTSTDLAIIATDLDFVIKYFNPEAERLYGRAAEQMLGRTVAEIHQEVGVDQKRFTHGIQVVKEQGEHPFDIRQTLEDGSERMIEARASGILDRQGRLTGYVLMSRDVTDARMALEMIARSERRYRLLIESANDAILIADADSGLIVDANLMAGELLGRTVAEVIGMHQSQLHPATEIERYQQLFKEQVLLGNGLLSGVDVVRKDGTLVPVEIRAGVTNLGDRQVILGIFRDVTERRRMEERQQALNLELEQRVAERTRELARSNQDLQQFAYVASHDLQEPLRLITGYVQLLQKRYQGRLDEQADKYIFNAIDGVNHMQSLINNLLSYARVGNSESERVSIDLNTVLERTLTHLEPTIQETGAVVTHDPLPTLQANPVLMGQLLQNLIGNAMKFRGDSPPCIHLCASRENKAWVIAIKDNGIGIEPKHQERIFLIFEKLHSRVRYEGTGIGLAMCKRIVERHGGRIWVESQPGQGSTFSFSILDSSPSV
ncbi:MAG: PAS domain S-box protein [Magnetococcales bacterium]|nr:PAS domain S-box protein [Magnetococcales bacterium]